MVFDALLEWKNLPEVYPTLIDSSYARWLMRNRKSNGLEQCGAAIKKAKKVYIHKAKFEAWLLQGGVHENV